MRLIDADALFRDLREHKIPFNADINEAIIVAPTIDPVKHGHWAHGREVSRDYVGDVCVSVYYDKWWCSKCNYHVEGYPLWKYCPCCGAKMDENEWEEPEINPCRGCLDYDGRGGCKSNGGCGVTDEVN